MTLIKKKMIIIIIYDTLTINLHYLATFNSNPLSTLATKFRPASSRMMRFFPLLLLLVYWDNRAMNLNGEWENLIACNI